MQNETEPGSVQVVEYSLKSRERWDSLFRRGALTDKKNEAEVREEEGLVLSE